MSDRKKSQKDVENVREERRTKKDSDSKSQKKDRSERKEKTEKPNKKKDLIVQAVQVPRSAAIALFKAAGLGSTSGSEIKARLSVPKPKAK
ncbi:hypothetical protein TRFO_01923 [Tritrichomonas foetus]|uniref:Uncharacterized protein n=1 Tax=Tritrichomonas foetus TaxID=1144522 RepID=A0A1J4JJP8_9EUKA|nr:hypothetical protein TRFO_01923 [Tritrichomonas foetus]|eukprot:OHS98841.1 hypothetical protein TRFO_01923 [Tritrichomonas foetus]